jgi:dTDP-4-amino-4,6-dideoxygalactose transaminase
MRSSSSERGGAVAAPHVPFYDLAALTAEVRPALDAATRRVLDRGWYVLGEEVDAFEREFAAYVGAKHAIGVGNGLDALVLSLRALGVGPGHEVIVPGVTFMATWLAVSAVGATPVGVEPEHDTLLIDPERVERAITHRTRAILPVHLYGQPADTRALGEIAFRHGLALLEDAAQAHGASDAGRRCGTLGVAAAWSFYPGKNLGAYGDGGAVTTDDDIVAARVRELRNYGSAVRYVHESLGANSRLDEMQAALLRAKLPHLDRWNARSRAVARRYVEGLDGCGLILPRERADARSSWHLFVIRSDDRDTLRHELAARGVECQVHYPIAPHRQLAYALTPVGRQRLPLTEAAHASVLSLPMGPHMTDAQVDLVIDAVREVLGD